MKIKLVMKKHLLLLSLLFLTSGMVFGDALTAVVADSKRVIQDPKTKVTYYLESDLRHIAALSQNGKLLWCCEIVPASTPRRVHIISFSFDDKDDHLIDVTSNPTGPEYGIIHKQDGNHIFRGED
jgi:hypothetical protein